MQNQYSRLFIVLFISLPFLAGCNLPQTPTPSVEPPGTLPVEPTTNGTTGTGGSASTEIPGPQNPLPAAVNLEKSSIDLEKLAIDSAGGGGDYEVCRDRASGEQDQKITLNTFYDSWQLCFSNFPQSTAEVHLSTRGGYLDTNISLEPFGPGINAHELTFDLPVSVLRDGPLQVDFTVEGITYSKSFDLESFDRVSIYQDAVNIPTNSPLHYFHGEQFELLGVNLLPTTTVFVGIYGFTIFDMYYIYNLIDQFEVTTNTAGEFFGTIRITEKYHQGNYLIFYSYAPDLLANQRTDRSYDSFYVDITSPTWQPCPANYASSLRVGDIGIVSDNPPLPNNVRNNPSLSGEKIGQLQPGEQFIILDGPVCNDGWVWWYVQSDSNGGQKEAITGWTSEGDAKNYWLVPDNPEQPNG